MRLVRHAVCRRHGHRADVLRRAGAGLLLRHPWGDQPLGRDIGIVDGELADPATVEAARRMAMAATIYHWGLHPWAIYAVVALSLALFAYNKGLPLTVRSIFYPIFGERIWGWPGHVIDILAVFATLFGLATSLGFGAQQASAGIGFVFGIEGVSDSVTYSVILIGVITVMALVSVLRGLDGGVKRLSEINMVLAVVLMLFVISSGPTQDADDTVLRQCRCLFLGDSSAVEPCRARRRRLPPGLDGFLLGLVDQLVALCRHVHRPRQPRPDGARVHHLRAADPDHRFGDLDDTFGGTAINQMIERAAESAVYGYVIAAYVPELSLFGMLSELPLATISSIIGSSW
jgi:betaine/carnitine transporter, BCCT family